MKKLVFISTFLLSMVALSQNAVVGPDFSSGWGGACGSNANFNYLGSIVGTSFGKTIQASGVAGDKFLRFGVDWSGTVKQLTLTIGSDVNINFESIYTLNSTCTTSGAIKFYVANPATFQYVFKTRNAGVSPNGDFIVFEVQGAVRSINTVSTIPYASPGIAQTISCTLNGTLSAGQGVYLRYTNDGWATSTVVEMSGSGTDYAAQIAALAHTAGSTINYYVFTSGDGMSINHADADFFTINYNNNGGSNYSYTVLNDTCGGVDVTYEGVDVWTPTVPDINKKAIIDYDLTIDGGEDLRVCSLVVNSGITLTINPGKTLRVVNDIENNGTIIIKNGASLIQNNDASANTGSGTYIVERETREYLEYDYTYWASPVSGETIADAFVTNSLLTMGTGSSGSSPNHIFYFDTAQYADDVAPFGYDDNINEWINASGTMTAGKGLIALGAGADLPFNASDLDSGFKQLITFEGTAHNGVYEFALLTDGSTSDTSYNENLIGNPYASSIDIRQLYNQNTSLLNPTFRFWSHDTQIASAVGLPYAYVFSNSDFATYNALTQVGTAAHVGSVTPNSYVASCQGFMVEAKQAGNLTFKNNMRYYNDIPSGYGDNANSNFFKTNRNKSFTENVIWLNMTNEEGLFRQLAIAFTPWGANQMDLFDSTITTTNSEPNFYSLPQGSYDKLVIQGMSEFEQDLLIPLGMDMFDTENLQISIDHALGIFTDDQSVYLEDTQEEIIHNLSDGPYTFTQTASTNINDRFILRFTNTQLGHEEAVLEDLKLYPNPTNGLLNIAYSGSEPLQIILYNQVGHTVGTYESVQVLDLSQLAQGMYFAKIANSQGSVTRKIVLE